MNTDFRTLIRRGSAATAVRALSAVAAFIITVLIARALGPTGTGVYFLATTLAAIGSTVGRGGADVALLQRLASFEASGRSREAKGVYRRALAVSVAGSSAASLVLIVTSGTISALLLRGADGVSASIVAGAIAVVPLTIVAINAEALKARNRVNSAVALQFLAGPTVLLVVIIAADPTSSAPAYTLAYSASTIAAALIGAAAWAASHDDHYRSVQGQFALRELLATSHPLWISAIVGLVISWTDVLMLSAMGTAADVGAYGVAYRLVAIIGFAIYGMSAIAAPIFGSLIERRPSELPRASSQVSAITVAAALLPAVVLIGAADSIIRVFGAGFENASSLVAVLAIGILYRGLTAVSWQVLIMSGHQAVVRNANVVGAVVNVGANALLIPQFGALGAATGTVLSYIVADTFASVRVRMLLGFEPTALSYIPFWRLGDQRPSRSS